MSQIMTSSLGCASRSCEPPKLGGSYETDSDGAPPGGRRIPDGPRSAVYQSYTDTGQSSDPLSSVGSRRAKTGFRQKPFRTRYGQNRIPTETFQNPSRPDGTRRIARLSRIGVRLIHGPIRNPTEPWRALTGPNPINLDPCPVPTMCDTERRRSTPPPLARAPRDEITACEQVLHSDQKQY